MLHIKIFDLHDYIDNKMNYKLKRSKLNKKSKHKKTPMKIGVFFFY